MITVKINLENGDYITTQINCTPEEAVTYYHIGRLINIGTTTDNLQQIKSLEFVYWLYLHLMEVNNNEIFIWNNYCDEGI